MSERRRFLNIPPVTIRTRGKRWLPDETSVLINTVYEKRSILSAKHETYGGTNAARVKAWKDVVHTVNSSFMRGRTVLQCFNKVRYVQSKAKKKYGDLLEKYGHTGAGGVARARKEMDEIEILSLQFKGILSVEGLPLNPTLTGHELEYMTESFYRRVPSISNQVVEEPKQGTNTQDDGDQSETVSGEEEQSFSTYYDVVPPPNRSTKRGRKPYQQQTTERVQLPPPNTRARSKIDTNVSGMTFPRNYRSPPNSPARNSVRANNILLEKVLKEQTVLKAEIQDVKHSVNLMLEHFDINNNNDSQRSTQRVATAPRPKSSRNRSSTPDIAPIEIESEQTTSADNYPDPLMEIPQFGPSTNAEFNFSNPILLPEPDEMEEPIYHKRSKKRKSGGKSKKKKKKSSSKDFDDVSFSESNIPSLSDTLRSGKRKKSKKSSSSIATSTPPPTKKVRTDTQLVENTMVDPREKPFTMLQLKSALRDVIHSFNETSWNLVIQQSKCSRKVFQEYESTAYKIIQYLDDDEENEICHFITTQIPSEMSELGRSRVMIVILTKIVDLRIINVSITDRHQTTRNQSSSTRVDVPDEEVHIPYQPNSHQEGDDDRQQEQQRDETTTSTECKRYPLRTSRN